MKKTIIAVMIGLALVLVAYATTTTTITITSNGTQAQEAARLVSDNKWTSGNKVTNYFSGLLIGARHATVTMKVGTASTETYTY